MNKNSKINSLKEKLQQALSSTARAISDDLKYNEKLDKNKSSKSR